MTLAASLIRRIGTEGPISIATYMQECLLHPVYGYYTTHDPFGAAGDFITAPEISQMFGELLGLCLAQSWLDQGRPEGFTLAELGPGRGTLMADLCRSAGRVPGFLNAAHICLVEASQHLRTIQKATLEGYRVDWLDQAEDLPKGPLFLVANEFFDALPIRQFQRDGSRWRERQIGIADERLVLGLGAPQPQPALVHRLKDTQDGDIIEDAPGLAPVIAGIGHQIAQHGGAALIIDYGDWRSLGDTLQALSNHERTDPLADPGKADLTAHVDFEAIALATPAGCRHTRLSTQGVFLERLGITQRAQVLAKNLQGKALEAHIGAHRRLTHPDEMGTLFKVMGLYPESAAAPPGLET